MDLLLVRFTIRTKLILFRDRFLEHYEVEDFGEKGSDHSDESDEATDIDFVHRKQFDDGFKLLPQRKKRGQQNDMDHPL